MDLTNKTVLVTGGGTGIGLALTEALVNNGNKVLICGRRQDKLAQTKEKFPSVEYFICDLQKYSEVIRLFNWASDNYPELSILINNAGMQRMLDLKNLSQLTELNAEIDVNLTSVINLCANFTNYFLPKSESAIVNVTSGLAFSPLARVPIYCATKAALHSYTMSLRHQLKNTSVKVIELIPPIVDTDLDKGTRDQRVMQDRGIQPVEVAEVFMQGFAAGDNEIIVGRAGYLKEMGDKMFEAMNNR